MTGEAEPIGASGAFDVAVVGGGPAGAAVAVALARAGAAVVLLERTDGTGNPVGESLPPSATPLLQRLGAWEAVAGTRPVAIHANRSAWGSPEPDERDFLLEPYGPGWRVDRPAFNAALLAEAERAGAVMLRRVGVHRVGRDGPGWRLAIAPTTAAESPASRFVASPPVIPSLPRALVAPPKPADDESPRQARDDGAAQADGVVVRAPGASIPAHAIYARFVVDATGRSATIARSLGARRVPFERLVGVVAMLSPAGVVARRVDAHAWLDAGGDHSRRPPGVATPGDGNEAPAGLRATSGSPSRSPNPRIQIGAGSLRQDRWSTEAPCSAAERLRSRRPGLQPRASPTDDRLTISPSLDAATLVEATPDGWWYSGLLPNGGLVAAFFSAPAILAADRAWHPDGWLALVRETGPTGERCAGFGQPAAAPFVAAAGMARLDRAAGDGWLAVGDAAACHDPLTSHGIGHALHHGPLAAATILAHLHGDAAALPDWADRVAADHERCRALLRAVYALETRWPDAPFWRSRAAG